MTATYFTVAFAGTIILTTSKSTKFLVYHRYHRLGGSPKLLYKSHTANRGLRQISTPQEAKTYVLIYMKLGMVDYIRDPTPHANFGGRRSTWVVWAHAWNISSLFSFFVTPTGRNS